MRASFVASDQTYGTRQVWKGMLAEGLSCCLHRIERLMRLQALRTRPRRRRLLPDLGERQATAVAANVLERSFDASAPNRKWIADFTYVWTAEGWLYVAAVIDLLSRRFDFDRLRILDIDKTKALIEGFRRGSNTQTDLIWRLVSLNYWLGLN